jgi:hypothetical protein
MQIANSLRWGARFRAAGRGRKAGADEPGGCSSLASGEGPGEALGTWSRVRAAVGGRQSSRGEIASERAHSG